MSSPHRCFLALEPDAATRTALARLCPHGDSSWQALNHDSLHLTLRFYGRIDTARMSQLGNSLLQLARPLPELQPAGSLLLPKPDCARVWALRYTPTQVWQRLADAAEQQAQGLGLAAESRPWLPHVSLARARGSATLSLPEPVPAAEDPCFRAAALSLLESVPSPEGRRYLCRARRFLTISIPDGPT